MGRLERKLSEQNMGAPPSYEEAVSESRSPVHSERYELLYYRKHLFTAESVTYIILIAEMWKLQQHLLLETPLLM